MKRILGIEGGGTKTEWLYCCGSEIPPKEGKLPGANLRLVTDAVLEEMFRSLPVEPTHVGVFLAGCANEADAQRLRACVLRVWLGAEVVVGGDRESGFATAFGEGDGIAIIAGTGSAITGRHHGRIEKAGGWGQLLGDKGSGYDLAVQALRHVLWNYDITRHLTTTTEGFLLALGLNRLDELVAWAKDADKMAVAKLAPLVFAAAARGDSHMSAILDDGVNALAEGASAVARRLGLVTPEIKLQGGLFLHHSDYVRRFVQRIGHLLPGATVGLCEESGAKGAVWLAGQPDYSTAKVEAEVDLTELADALTEQPNPRAEGIDTMSTPEVIDLFIQEEAQVSLALQMARIGLIETVELVTDALRRGGRLFYVGAGTSGRLGVLDASEVPPTFGVSPELVQGIMAGGVNALFKSVEGAEDNKEAGAQALIHRGVRHGDVVCGITASGRTPFVLGALNRARQIGAKTVLLACNPARRRNGQLWDVEIDMNAGPELITGSTRLKAGTATKCALNIISTGAMIRLGKTHGNWMSSLRVSNIKLRDRAIRLVAAVRGLNRVDAESALEAHGWDVHACLKQA
jgi:N-acetylmuramic acid 6-phosphate etherase